MVFFYPLTKVHVTCDLRQLNRNSLTKSNPSIPSAFIWATSESLWITIPSMVNVRSALSKTNNSPSFAAKMFCFQFCSTGLVACGIGSYSVCNAATMSTKTLACNPCTLTLMYKPASYNDESTPIDPFSLQTGWTLLLTGLLDPFLALLCSFSHGCFLTYGQLRLMWPSLLHP